MSSLWQIDSNDLPDPGAFKVVPFAIGTNQRLANMRLVTDIVGYKKRFEISWPTITWNYIDPIMDLYLASSFFTLTYQDEGATKTATVKITNSPEKLLLWIEAAANDWVYKDFALTMEEQ